MSEIPLVSETICYPAHMAAVRSPRKLEQQAALARLQAEEMVDVLSHGRDVLDSVNRNEKSAIVVVLSRLDEIARRLLDDLDSPTGITVAQAAAHLEVTEPTIRKWVRENLLKTIDGRKPIEITQDSVREVKQALEQVRKVHPTRQWSKALGAYLHDRDLRQQDWVATGIEQLKRGELVKR